MNPSDYREDFAAYHSALERENYRRHSGLSQQLELEPIRDRYGALWSLDAVEDLRRVRAGTSEQFETERAGLRALIGVARLGHSEAHAREVTYELSRCVEGARVEWDGARLAAVDIPDVLAEESDAARRAELARRWFDAVAACDDLRAARIDHLDAAVRSLGCADRRSLYESFTGTNLSDLSSATGRFMERTERAYLARLAAWAAREASPFAPMRELHFADAPFFERGARFDARFPAQSFLPLYRETFERFGVRVESQANLQIDVEPRTSKMNDTACFPVSPPDDVRLVLGARRGGLDFMRRSFQEAGRAQMFAWSSREAAARHPEFTYPPDAATQRGHAFLVAGLFREAGWLGDQFGIRAAEAEEIVAASALMDLYDARRECARLRHALALDGASDVRSESLAAEYAESFSEATGFRHETATHLWDADEWFNAATNLRGRLFAAGFREYLRGRYGRRWFASRGAGDELIDVWNTSSRYNVEELARLLWGGGLDFELLAEVLATGATNG